MKSKVIILTGASSGIGENTAIVLAKQGHCVYGAARRVDKIECLAKYGVKALKLDITNNDSVKEAVSKVIEEQGHIDILINNAGYGSYGAIEDVSIDEARRQFDVNLFGLATITKQVLPYMRKQKSGTIINISSMGGRVTTYFGAWYHATKYALEAFSDALRMEVSNFGIKVAIIEPGGIKTPWGAIAAEHLEQVSKGGAYEEQASRVAASMRKLYEGNMMSNPKVISKAISRAVNSKKPRARTLIGFGAKPIVFLHMLLPTSWFDFIMKRTS